MNKNDRALLLGFLDELSDRLANDGCNDWEWPRGWNKAYKLDFLDRYNAWAHADGDEDIDYDPEFGPNNVSLVSFLAYLVRQEIKQVWNNTWFRVDKVSNGWVLRYGGTDEVFTDCTVLIKRLARILEVENS